MGIELLQQYIDHEFSANSAIVQHIDVFKIFRFKSVTPESESTPSNAQEQNTVNQNACSGEDRVETAPAGNVVPRYEHVTPSSISKLIVDVDDSLYFLCGGKQFDWICGGEWPSLLSWLQLFRDACFNARVLPVPVFGGALVTDGERLRNWFRDQLRTAYRVRQIYRCVEDGRSPFVRGLWCAPLGTQLAIRTAFRSLSVWGAATVRDHPLELVSYAHVLDAFALVGAPSRYTAFGPLRIFSGDLRLTGIWQMFADELLVDRLSQQLHLSPLQLIILVTLLGNHILTNDHLRSLHNEIFRQPAESIPTDSGTRSKFAIETLARFVVEKTAEDGPLDAIAAKIFSSVAAPEQLEELKSRFVLSVLYYSCGRKEVSNSLSSLPGQLSSPLVKGIATFSKQLLGQSRGPPKQQPPQQPPLSNHVDEKTTEDEPSADEHESTTEQQTEGENGATEGSSIKQPAEASASGATAAAEATAPAAEAPATEAPAPAAEATTAAATSSGDKKSQQAALNDTPETIQMLTQLLERLEILDPASASSGGQEATDVGVPFGPRPPISARVLYEAIERHQLASISPSILHVLISREVRLPVAIEEPSSKAVDLPSYVELYRPVRERVYGVLLDVRKTDSGKESPCVKEWYLDQAALKPVAGECASVKPAADNKEKTSEQQSQPPAETGSASAGAGVEIKSETETTATAAEGGASTSTSAAKKCEQSADTNPIACVTVHATPLDLTRPPPPAAPAFKKVEQRPAPETQQQSVNNAEQPSANAASGESTNATNTGEAPEQSAAAAAAAAAETEQAAAKSATEEEPKSEQPAQPAATTATAAATTNEPPASSVPEQPSAPANSPRLEDLWFNSEPSFNEARIRALLFCMHNEPQWPLAKLLNLDMLPPARMAACLVLRYMLMKKVLRRYELDVFIATITSPLLYQPHYLQSIQLPWLEPRALHLASLFMAGLEHVSLANDACGAPVVSQCIAPWELFDGRLFHFKYLAAVARNYSSINQLLDHVAQQGDADRLRAATLEDLSSRGQLNSFFAHNPFSTPQEYFDARSRSLKHLRGVLGEPRDLEGEEGQEEAMVRALQGAGIPSLLSLSVNAPGAQMAAVPRMPAVAAVAAGAPALAASGGVTGLALGPPGAPFQALRFGLQPQPPLFAIPPGINVGAAPFAGRGRGFRSRPSGSRGAPRGHVNWRAGGRPPGAPDIRREPGDTASAANAVISQEDTSAADAE